MMLNKKLTAEFDTGLPEGEEPLKRVTIEALDFDWLFINDNCKNLLEVLSSDANCEVLTRRSIKIFIQLMWDHYQPAITKYMFFPYCIYLIIINYVSGVLIGNYLEMIDKQAGKAYQKNFTKDDIHKDDVNR